MHFKAGLLNALGIDATQVKQLKKNPLRLKSVISSCGGFFFYLFKYHK